MNTNGQKVSKVMTFIVVFACSMLFSGSAFAQRTTDKLDRGLIAMKVSSGVYINWRINAEEYYGVEYNVYRDGVKLNDTPLKVSNFTDKTGTVNSKYTVAAVVRGVEKPQCAPASVWSKSYKEIKLTHEGIKSTLVPNDACCADVDGDGEIDILMKFDNQSEMSQSYPKNGPKIDGVDTYEYSIFECLKQDGTRLWWVNCGPNMGDFQNNEQNIVAYDWDGDGKAEAIFRAADGTEIHAADGKTYVVGDKNKNWRGATGGGTNWFMHSGAEYLVYVNGETGVPYQLTDKTFYMDYPLKRLEDSENPSKLEAGGAYDGLVEKAWGDGYGHRSSKHFFGAPYLDGKKPSIFFARGIYTQIKMRAYDVDPATHKLNLRWDWRQTAGGYWMWQGFHNFVVADVDEDGRDEIVYGSMVVDDCGKGLSTTGFGHGDAQHVSDMNPYTKGLEIYTCLEDQPGNNYRDATTSKIYYRYECGNDDGRAMMANFTDQFPGCIGCSSRDGAISSVTYSRVSGMDVTGINTNFRIYWDGDLCSETFNYLNGADTEGCIAKYGSWSPIYTCEGSMTNNYTKGTPCYQGDILGDWREEIIMRTADNNIRIYSTPTSTTYRIPTLWSDHQYRNAMVWQMCGYNQPPHLSYFIGKLEGLTVAPPPLTMTGRDELPNGAVLDASYNGKHAIHFENGNTTISLANGAKPYIFTVNVPSWVQGTAGTNYTAKDATIKYTYYTCEVTDGYLDGDAMLVKQGDGKLKLPKKDFKHTGATNIWAGTLDFDGTLKNSTLWLNRFVRLNSNGGEFRSIKADYASEICPGDENSLGTITTDSLALGFGSRLVIDIYSDGLASDKINAKYLSIERKTGTVWTQGGPKYLSPVLVIVPHLAAGEDKIAPGKYILGQIGELATGSSVSNIILEGIATSKKRLYVEDGNLVLEVQGLRDAGSIVWTGAKNSIWDLAETENFTIENEPATFVSEDKVLFTDGAKTTTVSVNGELSPASMEFNGSSNYTISGTGAIVGATKFTNNGTGTVTMAGKNTYTGGNYLKGGVTVVSLLSNQYSEVGNLGGVTTNANLFTMENGAVLRNSSAVEQGSPMKMIGENGGVIENNGEFKMDAAFSGTKLTKKGSGWLIINSTSSLGTLVATAGTVDAGNKVASKIELQGTASLTGTGFLTTPIFVADKAKANLTTINRTTTNLALTGTGQITVYCATEKGSNYYATRTPIQLNLKNFEGTLVPQATYAADGRFTFDTSNGGDMWTLNIPASRYVQNSGKTLRIGNVTGTGELGGSCAFSNGTSVGANTWQVGNDANFTFDGKVVGSDKFTKMGTGRMTTSGVWTTTGAVSVDAGTLQVKSGSTLGTGSLTVGANGFLLCVSKSATVPMTNSSFTINGGLQVGSNAIAISGFTHFNNKAVTFGAKSRLILGLRKGTTTTTPNNAYITAISTLKFTDGATIAPTLYDGFVPTTDPASPDKFILWTEVKTANVGNVNFELPELPAWNYWDTSDIKNGILYIRCNEEIYNAIEGIASDDIVNVDVTNMSGMVVAHFTCPMANVKTTFAAQNLKGVFVLNIVNEEGKHTSVKISK